MLPPIHNVAVVGGTHGNEYTGVFCVKALQRKTPPFSNNDSTLSPYKFELSTVIGNPAALLQNKRFVDNDLNRQFSYEALEKARSAGTATKTVEQERALQLNDLLGPKQFDDDDDDENSPTRRTPKMDLIIDLHTTTANMGITLIVGQDDVLTTQCAAYVMQKCPYKTRILMHTHAHQKDRPHLSSIAPHSFTIEVGAVPQGVLRHDKVEEMQAALMLTLEFVQRLQEEGQQAAAVQDELRRHFVSGRVPCYRSAPAIRPGEMSAKLQWPSADDNPNFPLWLVHKSVQDKDFAPIRTGDPLFVDLDGNVIPYDGSYGSPVTLMFINEGGYYYGSSGTGIAVAMHDEFDLETGRLVSSMTQSKEQQQEEGQKQEEAATTMANGGHATSSSEL
jgi:succinylglutamate desuccinylase